MNDRAKAIQDLIDFIVDNSLTEENLQTVEAKLEALKMTWEELAAHSVKTDSDIMH